jgi:hypothetical protein
LDHRSGGGWVGRQGGNASGSGRDRDRRGMDGGGDTLGSDEEGMGVHHTRSGSGVGMRGGVMAYPRSDAGDVILWARWDVLGSR